MQDRTAWVRIRPDEMAVLAEADEHVLDCRCAVCEQSHLIIERAYRTYPELHGESVRGSIYSQIEAYPEQS